METDDAASRFRTAANAANAASVGEKDSDGAEDAPAKARTSYIESPTAARFRAAATAVSAVDRMRLAAENEKLKALQDQVDKVKALQDRHVQRLPAPLRCLLCGACWTAYGVRDMITKPGTIEFAGAFIFGEAFGALITSISADLVGPIMSVILPPWDPLVFAWGAAGFLVISVPLGPNATGYEPVSKEEALADGASILDFGHLGQASGSIAHETPENACQSAIGRLNGPRIQFTHNHARGRTHTLTYAARGRPSSTLSLLWSPPMPSFSFSRSRSERRAGRQPWWRRRTPGAWAASGA